MKTIFKYNLKDYLPTKAIPARTVAGGHKTNAGELTLAGTGNNSFKLYPNPASNCLNIAYQISESNSDATLTIYDVLGNQIMNIILPASQTVKSIGISKLSEGVYFYSIVVNNNIEQRGKLIIAR